MGSTAFVRCVLVRVNVVLLGRLSLLELFGSTSDSGNRYFVRYSTSCLTRVACQWKWDETSVLPIRLIPDTLSYKVPCEQYYLLDHHI